MIRDMGRLVTWTHRLALLALLTLCSAARAHFVFIVPQSDAATAQVVLSEELAPDEQIDIKIIPGFTLTCYAGSGEKLDVPVKPGDAHSLVAVLPGSGQRVVRGSVEFGVRQHGDKPAYLVSYHPKVVLGNPFQADVQQLDPQTAAEIIAVGAPGSFRFQVLAGGKPVSGVELNILLPDGTRSKPTTDAAGCSPVQTQTGRYGVWGRYVDATAGERDGKAFAEARHYPTLVIDVAGAAAQAGPPPLPRMPQAVSSFGAVEADGYVYIYGGHAVRTHSYSTDAVSWQFHRLSLTSADAQWEALPGGPAVQGMNLASHDGRVYRVGGMQPRNQPGAKVNNHSIADAACYDPQVGMWLPLPTLPAPRSSHDVAFIGNTLYVVGGWAQKGGNTGNDWHDHMLTLDLTSADRTWRKVDQPFIRRALIVAVHAGKLYVLGGLTEDSEISREVNIYDPAAGSWSTGPQLPGEGHNGFSPAACDMDGQLYVSLADGSLHRLDDQAGAWKQVASTTPRIVHRMVAFDNQLVILGGADRKQNHDLVETVRFEGELALVNPQPQVDEDAADIKRISPPTTTTTSAPGTEPAPKVEPTHAAPVATEAPQAVAVESSAPPTPVVAAQPIAFVPTKLPAVGAAQTHCPIMTDTELGKDDPEIEYHGVKVRVCCDACLQKFEADPDAYVQSPLLPQLKGMELPRRQLAQVYCPVYPQRVVSAQDPFVMYQGQKIYLFNRTAVKRWNADPERYANPQILPQLANLPEQTAASTQR